MTVVHCKRQPFTHYIGRPGPFGNPYSHLPKERTAAIFYARDREESIAKFEEYAMDRPALLEMIKALPEDAVLGCWCVPLPCHGNVIVRIWKKLHEERNAH